MLQYDIHKPGLERDLKTLALFVGMYCQHHHTSAPRQPVDLKTHDVESIHGKTLELCEECTRLLAHAFVKRTVCPMNPKPECKHCPNHCYAPKYRAQIRQVMKSSGMRLMFTGRVHYLLHLLF